MESNLKYVYQLSLADGKVLINECDGLFSVNGDDKVVINSAVLIKIVDAPQADVQPVVDNLTHDAELVQNEQLVDQATQEYLESVNVVPAEDSNA